MAEPITDEELDEMEKLNIPWADNIGSDEIGKLIAEVRRLRSDEWLEKAAEEAEELSDFKQREDGDSEDPQKPWRVRHRAEILEILRKHRDGR